MIAVSVVAYVMRCGSNFKYKLELKVDLNNYVSKRKSI